MATYQEKIELIEEFIKKEFQINNSRSLATNILEMINIEELNRLTKEFPSDNISF